MKSQSDMGRSNTASSKCCNSSWLLYLLVILALVLSGLNFWMNLYRHEQLRFEVSAIDKQLNKTNEKIKNPDFLQIRFEISAIDKKLNETIEKITNPELLDLSLAEKSNIKARLIYEVMRYLIRLIILKSI